MSDNVPHSGDPIKFPMDIAAKSTPNINDGSPKDFISIGVTGWAILKVNELNRVSSKIKIKDLFFIFSSCVLNLFYGDILP